MSTLKELWGARPSRNDPTAKNVQDDLDASIQEAGDPSNTLDELWAQRPRPDNAEPITIDRALDQNPDEVAKRRRDVEKVGMPPEAANQDTAVISKEAERQRVAEDLDGHPISKRTMADPANAAVMIDDISSLTWMERIARGFERGIITRELGQAGYEASLGDEVSLQRAQELNDRLQKLGKDDEGFVSFLAASAKILGMQYSSFTDPDAAVRIGGGAAVGAAVGAAGGPLAPVTSAAGGLAGLSAGAVSHFTVDAFQVEAGHAYLEQIDEGIDQDVARVSATAVGLLNAGLEIVGAKLLLAPLGEAKRAIFREGIRKFARTEGFKGIATRAAKTWAMGVSGEVATEVMQESVNIVATEISKQFSEGDFEDITSDEVAERLAGIAEETFRGTVLLAGGGSAVQLTTELAQARKAKKNLEKLEELRDVQAQSPAAKRDPEAVAKHVADATKQNARMDSVYIPSEAMMELATGSEQGRQLVADLGLDKQIADAYEAGADVKLSVEDFVRDILPSDAFETIKDQIRVGPEEMNVREAELLEASDFEAEMGGRPTNDPVELAEQEMGQLGLFRSADEAGMSASVYEGYLKARAEAADVTRQRQERKRLRQEERELGKEFEKEREYATSAAQEEVAQQPVFEVLNSIGVDRLDRAAVEQMLPNGAEQLNELPKSNGRAIVTQRGQRGVDPDLLAEAYGFADGQHMLFSMIDAGNFADAVQARAEVIFRERNPDFTNREKAIEEARESLANSSQAKVLEIELNALREAQGQGTVSAKALRDAVKRQVQNMPLHRLEPTALMNSAKRAGREAGQLLRKGDRAGASAAKLRQLKALQAAQEAYRWRADVLKKRRYLKQFSNKRARFPSLPVEYREQIQEALQGVSFGARITEAKEKSLRDWAARKFNEGTPVDVEELILAQKTLTNYQDMKLGDFLSLYNTVRALHKQGLKENKMNQIAEERSRDEIVAEATASMRDNVTPRETSVSPTTLDRAMSGAREYALLMATPDTILRELDGFTDLGPMFQAIKGRYNRAYTSGYNEGQIGVAARQEQEAAALVELDNVYTAKERANMRRPINIPGLDKQISHDGVLAVLYNLGNLENREVLLNTFTEAEISTIMDYASEKDWDHAQAVWDYIDKFWPEIEQATIRRKNFRPQKVEAASIETKYGTYKGGYYPIRFDKNRSAIREETLEDLTKQVRFGNYVSSHTRDGHTKERKGAGDRQLLLERSVVNAHVKQVLYDLEMGDAVNDIYKILHHPEMKKAFQDLGRVQTRDALDLWLQDVIAGEMFLGGIIEHTARYLRSGFTVSKLGLNFGTTMLQPLGLLQSAALVNKRALMRSTINWLKNPFAAERFALEVSGLMRQRQETFNKDITLASQQLSGGGLIRNTVVGNLPDVMGIPEATEKTAQFAAASFFYAIKKAQWMVDVITFNAAYMDGLRKFDGDEAKAIQFAESMDVRTQASGIFGDRAAIERGTLRKGKQQTELVRLFTPLMSYFIAKNNIMYERTVNTGRELLQAGNVSEGAGWLGRSIALGRGAVKNPGKVTALATDAALLYIVEALVVAWLRGELPDSEDEEAPNEVVFGLTEGMKTFTAGLPFIREALSEAEGFRGGGVFGSVLGEFGKFLEQADQGAVDEALVKSGIRLGGTILRLPSSQPINTGMAIRRESQGEDMELLEFIYGPRYYGPR